MIRRTFTALTGLFLFLNLAACTTPSTTNPTGGGTANVPPQQTPAQVAAQICPPLQVALAGLRADIGLPQGALHDLALAAPQVQNLCAGAALAGSNDAAALENLAFQVVLPIAEAQDPRLGADLLALQFVLAAFQAAQAQQAAPSTLPAAK
ncbi:MAG: hypothetical protein JO002_02390 [Burkholderiaceae bacterium]|nr:hypothetical protein [Burkholderiaceae bacterium]